jgi:hypothetical protein
MAGSEEPDMKQCVWLEDTAYAFRTETACAIRATELKDMPAILQSTANSLFAEYGYVGRQGYALFCIPEDEMKQFYRERGVPADDLPENT